MTEEKQELATVDTKTGEVVAVDERKLDRMSIETAKQQFQYLKEFKESILEAGVDFDVIPGTEKVAILQPAGQKLARAFQIAIDYDVAEKTEDFWKLWTYPKRQQDGSTMETEVRGWAYYRVVCQIKRLRDDKVICQGFGIATSSDKGAEEKPFHSLLLSAKKRAMMNGVLEATASSGLFMADLDEFPELKELIAKRAADKAERRATEPASDKQIGLVKILADHRDLSPELQKEVDDFRKAEREQQLKAVASSLITKLKAIPERQGGQRKSQSSRAASETPSANGKSESNDGAPSEIISDIARMESDLWNGRKDMANMVNRSRIEYCGSVDLRKSTPEKLKNYAQWLAAELGA